jgi:hypothetical protein
MKEKIHRVFVWLTIIAVAAGCGVYSFTGASIDPNVKTFTVHFISNQAPLVVPSLSQTLTDGLRNRFLTNTNLNQVDNGGDLEFSGSITNYAITPVAVQANETAALNRLTITLSMEFINHQNEKQNWTSTFSRYADYNSSSDITSIQDELIRLISEQLIEDVFNKAVVNW